MIHQLNSFKSIISDVNKYEHHLDGSLEQFKATAILVDGSRLHINEVWIRNVLHKYAYYWLDPTGNVIQGWDNAPYHTHIGEQVYSFNLRSLADVLQELEKHFLKQS